MRLKFLIVYVAVVSISYSAVAANAGSAKFDLDTAQYHYDYSSYNPTASHLSGDWILIGEVQGSYASYDEKGMSLKEELCPLVLQITTQGHFFDPTGLVVQAVRNPSPSCRASGSAVITPTEWGARFKLLERHYECRLLVLSPAERLLCRVYTTSTGEPPGCQAFVRLLEQG